MAYVGRKVSDMHGATERFFLYWILFSDTHHGDRGGTVIKVLCYKSEGRWFDPSWCHWNFSFIKSFRLHYGPEVDPTSNRKEHQERFLGVKAAGA